jgi:hypothetical protein
MNWAAIAALIPGRTQKQCRKWLHILDANIDRTPGRTGKWAEEKDIKLKGGAVQLHQQYILDCPVDGLEYNCRADSGSLPSVFLL